MGLKNEIPYVVSYKLSSRFAGVRARAARATSDKTSATSPGADHLTPLAFLVRPIFRIQFAPPVQVSNF